MLVNLLGKINSYLTNKGFFWLIFFNLNPKAIFADQSDKKILNFVKKQKITYQPIRLSSGITIPKKSDSTIVDSRKKLKKIALSSSYKNKSVLDIGCAEGFFLIDAALRGSKKVLGIDPEGSRVNIAKRVIKNWNLFNKISVKKSDYQSLKKDDTFDIVYCFSVVHHQHGKVNGKNFADTWKILTDRKYKKLYGNMLSAVKKVASHTNEVTIWEYPFTYKGSTTSRSDVDFELLGKKWVEEGMYKKVDFIGFSSRNAVKDRPLYKAYKHDYIREDKGFYMDFYKDIIKISYSLLPSIYNQNQKMKSFNNILASLKYFKKINWPYAPKIIKVNIKSKIIEMERINGKTLIELILENKFSNWNNFEEQFKDLEKSLTTNRINYTSATIKDIMRSKSGKFYLLDYERCYPNKKYKGTLISELFMDLIKRMFTNKVPINSSSFLLLYSLSKIRLFKSD